MTRSGPVRSVVPGIAPRRANQSRRDELMKQEGFSTRSDRSTPRAFTPARVVALVVIAAAVASLAYLRFSPDDPVSVPSGAKAGDLSLESCSYKTEQGKYSAECGTLVVPENWADPQSRLIALPVTRIGARSANPAEPIFWLEGGPGLTNMEFPEASRLTENHDVVLVGYRGVDGSSVLDCPEVVSALRHSVDLLAEATASAQTEALASCAQRLRLEGVDLAGYTLPQRIEDFEAAREALGYDRINLISESVGSRTAMIYARRYPERVYRSVMIGGNPPGHFMWDPRTTDEQIERYADLCGQDETCRTRTDDLAASMRRTAGDIPDRWLFLPIKEGNVRVGTFFGLMESTMEASPLTAPMQLDSWLSAADGDASGFWFMTFLADFVMPELGVWGDYAAVGMQDAEAVDAYYAAGGDPGSILGNPGTDFVWARGGMTRAWPENPARDVYSRVQTSQVETLVIGGTLDFAAPPVAATEELLPSLPNGHQVVLAEIGHTTSFWAHQPEAGNRLLNHFYDTGQVDDSLYEPASVDFTPPVTYTALGKGFLGGMVGFALVALLSLVWWMPRHVQKRGSFGPVGGVLMRSAYTIVLGFGGWFLVLLVVMTTGASVALDSMLMSVLSVGVPVGVGIYLAWVHRDWTGRTKTVGFLGAMAGALLGGWAGFSSTEGLLALITAIVGAAVGANLVLIALDISRDRSGRPRPVEGQTVRESTQSTEPGVDPART
jgi:pimeloyl-ACP methyl ester carboxylesterase